MSTGQVIALAVVVFASTNLDDIFLLVGFFADSRFAHRHIIGGQFLGIGTLVALSLVTALAALAIPPAYIGLLGIAPILIGAKRLWDGPPDHGPNSHPSDQRRSQPMTVAAVTIANGGDNIGIYTPMFATQSRWEIAVTISVFALMTLAWCAAAKCLVTHPLFGRPMRRYGSRTLPFVLIGIGLFILYEGGTLALLRGGGFSN